VATVAHDHVNDQSALDLLSSRYLSYLDYAFNEGTGRFRNLMTYDRKWLEGKGSEDSHGRAMWGIGIAVNRSKTDGQVGIALSLFRRGLPAVREFRSPRAIAFSLVGIQAYLVRFAGDREVQGVRHELAERLLAMFRDNATEDWPWLEKSLHYANAKVPHALIQAGRWMRRQDMIEIGLRSLEWLVEIQTDDGGHFVPIGTDGWYERGGQKARFDQQPVEAHAMIDACVDAHRTTRDGKWLEVVRQCFDWFLGRNDLQTPLYDHATGGCRDGLYPAGANENQGAESTLAWLMSLLTLYERQHEQPSLPGK